MGCPTSQALTWGHGILKPEGLADEGERTRPEGPPGHRPRKKLKSMRDGGAGEVGGGLRPGGNKLRSSWLFRRERKPRRRGLMVDGKGICPFPTIAGPGGWVKGRGDYGNQRALSSKRKSSTSENRQKALAWVVRPGKEHRGHVNSDREKGDSKRR